MWFIARSIHDDADDLDPYPERVELMAEAAAEGVVAVPAALVVEPRPQPFLVPGQLDLERLARRQALRRPGRLGLEEQGVGQARLRRQRQRRLLPRDGAGRAVHALPRLLAVAPVDAAAGPDAHHVPL